MSGYNGSGSGKGVWYYSIIIASPLDYPYTIKYYDDGYVFTVMLTVKKLIAVFDAIPISNVLN